MAFLLLGLSLFAGLRYFGPRVDLTHQKSVSRQISDTIQKSLWTFVSRNKRLPCPANGADTTTNGLGVENCSFANPAAGVLPWKTLGLPQAAVEDSWGHLIGYSVTAALATETPYAATVPTSDAVKVTINSATSSYAYVLMSFGPDGGSYTLSGGATAVTSAAKASAADVTNEGVNRSAIAGGGLSTAFIAPTATGGATGGQWLVFETSSQVCNDVNGQTTGASKPYCNNNVPQNGSCGSGGVCNTQTLVNGLAVTSSAQSSNPNGVSSNAVVVSAGLNTPVLVLGSSSTTTSITAAPTLTNSSQACSWETTPLPFINQTLRAYFEFSTVGNTSGDGFTFSLLPAATDMSNSTPCGGTPGGLGTGTNTNEGSYLGFEAIVDGGLNGTAIGVPTVAGGVLTGISTAAAVHGQPGQGYMWVPPVEITDTGASPGSGASAYVSQMQLHGIIVTNPGYGYVADPGHDPRPGVIVAPAGGAGYASVPAVTIETAAATGCTPTCTDNATATALVTNGRVTGLQITHAGTGYLRAPAVTIGTSFASGCTALASCADAIGASATIDGSTGAVTGLFIDADTCGICTRDTAKVNSMAVTGVAVIGGSGYLVPPGGLGYTGTPTVFIGPGSSGGSGASANVSVNSGSLTGIGVVTPGSNYAGAVQVTVAGGGIAYATILTVTNGQVAAIQLQNGGSGYPATSQFNFTLPAPLNCASNCLAAKFQATVNASGVVTGVAQVSGGNGYSTASDVGNWAPVNDGTHQAVSVQATVGNTNTITAIPLPASSSPLTPTVTVLADASEPYVLTPGAAGVVPIVSATLSATVNSSGVVTGMSIDSVGTGYTVVPTIQFSAPPGCAAPCATQGSAQVASMGVAGITVTGATEQFPGLPSIGIDPPVNCITNLCYRAAAVANMSVTGITIPTGGSGYTQSSMVVTMPPPTVLPKLAIEFRTYHHPTDPYYSDYGYHDDWGYFGSVTGATYTTGTAVSSAQVLPSTTQLAGEYVAKIQMPRSYYGIQAFGGNIRHDDNTGCDGPATTTCVPEYMSALLVDALHRDVTYHYSTTSTNNAAYTISPSCDSTPGTNAVTHGGGFTAGGGSTGGALATMASVTSATSGGCTYDSTSGTPIVTANGPINDTENGTTVKYHSARVEVRRYCDPTCSSCGNQGTAGDTYMQVAAWLDCDSTALNGASCKDLTRNLLVTGSQVLSVDLTNSGTGYTSAPTVSFDGGGGIGAAATARFANGVITLILTSGGSGYVTAPTVTLSGGGGNSDATATARISGLPLPASYTRTPGNPVYAMNFCTIDPGATTWTPSQRGLSSLDNILTGFTVGAGAATRGVLIRNLQVGTFN